MVTSDKSTVEELVSKYLEISFNCKEGFICNETPIFKILFDVIYDVTYNIDGQLTTVKVKHNNSLNEPAIPIKTGYTFSHWELNGERYDFNKPVNKKIELVAIWNINKYQISFVTNNDLYGNFDKTDIIVDYGSKIEFSNNKIIVGDKIVFAIPTIADVQYSYQFVNWSQIPENNIVVSDIVIMGNFIRLINEYEVEWIVDGTTTKEVYKYGEMPKFKGNTSKLADQIYTYTFVGWDKEISNVTGNVSYTAKYDKEYI